MIVTKTTLTVLLIFVFFNSLLAQENNPNEVWILEYNDGTKVEAAVKSFHTSDQKIKYRDIKTNTKEKVSSDELNRIFHIYKKDTLKFTKMNLHAYKSRGKLFESKRPFWVAKVNGTDKIEGYIYGGQDYSYSYNSGRANAKFVISETLAIRIVSENYVFSIGLKEVLGNNGKKTANTIMNRNLKKYLADYCPEFAAKITDDTYNTDELNKIIDDYTNQCK